MTLDHSWTVVLAAGQGSRLKAITTTASGETIPKQFCSLNRRECLLELALDRAAAIADPAQRCAVVAAQHRRWWTAPLGVMPEHNIFVQPENKGTAIGAALALLKIQRRDPDALVVLLPADHYVRDESTVAQALENATRAAYDDPKTVFLLGATPESADSELGYILPRGVARHGVSEVDQFVEKPSVVQAQDLIVQGALWNMFIVVSSVSTLLNVMDRAYNFIDTMRRVLPEKPGALGALRRVYKDLPSVDLSRDVLAYCPDALKVYPVPFCGWTDLGTPSRVRALVQQDSHTASFGSLPAVYLDLARAALAAPFA